MRLDATLFDHDIECAGRKDLNTAAIDQTDARPLDTTTAPMVDPFGRAVTYLRVSVTDRCDFRCTYCMCCQAVVFVRDFSLYSPTLRLD